MRKIEILCFGQIEKDFQRLGVQAESTYRDTSNYLKTYLIDNENFLRLCNDTEEFKQEGVWLNVDNYGLGNWNSIVDINNASCFCWLLDEVEDSEEFPEFKNVLEYIEKALNVKSDWKVCQILNDLAKLNHMSLSKFLKTYQG